jgi:1-acyl-sn-glycerol-3-phosphate acyltransferase
VKLIRKLFGAVFLLYGLVMFFGVMLLVFPFIILSSFIGGKAGSRISLFFLRTMSFLIMLFCVCPIIIRRNKKTDPDKSYIYVSNHNSYLDSPSVVLAIPSVFKPLGKIEMTKIPVFGSIYKRVVVLIDRSSKESRAQSVENLKTALYGGTSILIFPEGTMNTDEDLPVKEFYDGAFRIAIETQTPIAPFVIINARKLLPRKQPLLFRPGLVRVYFADPVMVEGYTQEQLPELKEKVHEVMRQLILEHQN